jgi:NitT/TauT family transport system substrate-binding protein
MAYWLTRRAFLGASGAAMSTLGVGCQAPPAPLRVGAIAFAGYEFMQLAQQLGLLQDSGVRLQDMRSSTDALRGLATRRLEAAALTLDEVITGLHDGIPLKVVMVFDVSDGADAVMARSPLANPADARGHRVGVEHSAVGALMLAAFLEAARLEPEDIVQVATPLPESAQALRSGRVDVVVTAEPWASQLQSAGALRLFDSSAIPGRIVDVLAVHANALQQQAGAVQRLVQGQLQALARYRANPKEHALSLSRRLQIAPDDVAGALRGLDLPDRAANLRLLGPGGPLQKGMLGFQDVLLKQGLLGSRVDASGLFDSRFVQAAG